MNSLILGGFFDFCFYSKFLQTLSKYAIMMKKEDFYDSRIYQSK